jgi:ketosteroid isomerase-like protein
MSEENVEIVRSIYEAFNRREWDAVFRDAAPDCELTTPPRGPNSGTYRGREEFEGHLRELITPFEASAIQPEEFFERGDQVAVVYEPAREAEGTMRTRRALTLRRLLPQPGGFEGFLGLKRE